MVGIAEEVKMQSAFVETIKWPLLAFTLMLFLYFHFIGVRSRALTRIFAIMLVFLVGIFFGFVAGVKPVGVFEITMLLLSYSIVLFVVISNWLMMDLAERLTRVRGAQWVKEMEYLYLLLGSLGIVGSVNKIEMLSGRMSKLDMIGPLLLATAVVLRIIKTRAEIGGWAGLSTSPPAAPSA